MAATAHDTGDDSVQEELAALRGELDALKKRFAEALRTPAFYSEEINKALAVWLKQPKNLDSLAKAMDRLAQKLQ